MSDWFTKIHTNAMILSILLTALQIYILWEMNGALKPLLLNAQENLDALILVFGPTIGLGFALRKFADAPDRRKDGDHYGK